MDNRQHGYFGSETRIALHSICTTESFGFTRWHQLAAGMLCEDEAISFLESTLEISANDLIDDLRESMTVFDSFSAPAWEKNCDYRQDLINGKTTWSWEQFRKASAWKTPLEICSIVQQPLVRVEVNWYRMHPIVAAAHQFTWRNITQVDLSAMDQLRRRWKMED